MCSQQTLYVTTDAKDFSKLAELLVIYGTFVKRLVCEISPGAVKSETQMQDLTDSLGLCRQLKDVTFEDDEGYYSERSDSISAQNTLIMRALLPLAPQLRSLRCGGSRAILADYVPGLAVLLPRTTRLQYVDLSIYANAGQESATRAFSDTLLQQASVQILVLSEQILIRAERVDLPRIQHLDLDFDELDDDEGIQSRVTGILQSASPTLRHIGMRLPDHKVAQVAQSITFPELESLRLCGHSAALFMFATIKSASSMETLSLCGLNAAILDRLWAFHAKQPGKALREVVINRESYTPGRPETDVSLLRLRMWAIANGIQVSCQDEDAWSAGELEKSQRRAGLRPLYI